MEKEDFEGQHRDMIQYERGKGEKENVQRGMLQKYEGRSEAAPHLLLGLGKRLFVIEGERVLG